MGENSMLLPDDLFSKDVCMWFRLGVACVVSMYAPRMDPQFNIIAEAKRQFPHFYPKFAVLKHYDMDYEHSDIPTEPEVKPFSSAAAYRADVFQIMNHVLMYEPFSKTLDGVTVCPCGG